jgi:hypothetical protein
MNSYLSCTTPLMASTQLHQPNCINLPGHPSQHSLGSYKWLRDPQALTASFPLSPELLHAFVHPHNELKPPLFFASVAPPLCCRSCSGEHPSGTASFGLSSSTVVGEHRRALVPVRSVPARRRHTASVHGGPEPCRPVHASCTQSTAMFPIEK